MLTCCEHECHLLCPANDTARANPLPSSLVRQGEAWGEAQRTRFQCRPSGGQGQWQAADMLGMASGNKRRGHEDRLEQHMECEFKWLFIVL
jgi:hypothetical protein